MKNSDKTGDTGETVPVKSDSRTESQQMEEDKSMPMIYFNEIDRMLDSFRKEFFSSGWDGLRKSMLPRESLTSELERFIRHPLTNITSDNNNIYIKTEVPGLDKDELMISIHNGILKIKGEPKTEIIEEEGEYLRKEYYSSKFYRSYTLPEEVNEDKIEASLEKGILSITLPKNKSGKTKEKKIEIN